jgi:hypothetical protein
MINWILDITASICIGALLLFILFLCHQNNNLQKKYEDELSQNAAMQLAISEAQRDYKKQLSSLQIREEQAKKHAIESQQRATEIMNSQVSNDCRKAMDWMIQQS